MPDIGITGGAIARRIAGCGHDLRVCGLEDAKPAPFLAMRANAAETAADAAKGADFVITRLNSVAIVRTAVFGERGAAACMAPQSLRLDMSSIDRRSARPLGAVLRARCGAGWEDAPLSGRAPMAQRGQLTVMAGGTSDSAR